MLSFPLKTLFLCPQGWCLVEGITPASLLSYDALIPWIKENKTAYHFFLVGGEIERLPSSFAPSRWRLFRRVEPGLITSFSRPLRYVVSAELQTVLQILSQQSFHLRKISLVGLSQMKHLLSQQMSDGWLIGFFSIVVGINLMVVSYQNAPLLERILPEEYDSAVEIQRTLQHLKRYGYREKDPYQVVSSADPVFQRRGDVSLKVLCLAPHQRRYWLYKGIQGITVGGGVVFAGIAITLIYYRKPKVSPENMKPPLIQVAPIAKERPQLSLTLNGVVYKDRLTWAIWINGQKYTSDDAASPDFTIQEVTPTEVKLNLRTGECVRLFVNETYASDRLRSG